MSQDNSRPVSRRQAIAGSLGVAGVFAAQATSAAAETSTLQKRRALKDKKVLVAIGEFSEGLETYYMIYRLMEEGVKPVVAADSVKRLQLVVHDFEPEYSNYTEKPGYFIETDIAYEDVEPADYDALLIPGGRGPEEIRQYEAALRVTRYFIDNQRPVGAMCHGPQLLYAARGMKGRRMAAYQGIRADVEAAGATYVDEPVVVDGQMVTSRGWPDLPFFMPPFLEVIAAS
ncbi:MAG: DJ-1/PfpI family protein [Planctomycetota bacterium]